MTNIRINDLPSENAPNVNDLVPIDGVTTRKTTLDKLVNAGRPLASQAEAEAGTEATKAMTALTVRQAIAVQGGAAFATAAQGSKADSAVQSLVAGQSTSIDATDPQNPIVAFTGTGTGDMLAANDLSEVSDPNAALLNIGAGPTFDTKALASAFAPKTAPNHIRTAGYTAAGDGGGALHKKVASEPSHLGKLSITLSDGVTVVWYEISETVVRPGMFGAVADSVADDTDPLVSMFSVMQTKGAAGQIPEGRYKVREGEWEWALAAGLGDRAGPTLYTVGKVVICAAGVADAPLLSIHNDIDIGGGSDGNGYVSGGYVGPMWFEDTTGDTAPNRHGIELYGVQFMNFGVMSSGNSASDSIKGDLVHLRSVGDQLTADRWQIYACNFEGIRGWFLGGWNFNNNSVNQVFNGCHIRFIWCLFGSKGGFKGAGSGNFIYDITVGWSGGWAIDLTPDVGTVQRFWLGGAELDAPQFGIRIQGVQNFYIGPLRISYRYDTAGLTPPLTMWPSEGVRVGGSGGYSTSFGEANIIHYFRDSVTADNISNLNTLITFSGDTAIEGLDIKQSVLYTNSGFSVTDGQLAQSIAGTLRGMVVRDQDRILYDSRRGGSLRARQLVGEDIGVSGGLGANHVSFPSVTFDDQSAYDTSTGNYTCQRNGKYQINAQIGLEGLTSDTTVRLAVMVDFAGGGGARAAEAYHYASGTGKQTYAISCIYECNMGDKIWISADQATASTVTTASGNSFESFNRFEITPV